MTRGMVFGVVVTNIFRSGAPVDHKLALPDTIF